MMHDTRVEYTKSLDLVTDSCIDTLIEYAAGKQIVIPLSGGRDSRLIAIKLVLKNYKNILCYSYGLEQHQETVVSREVSEKLGLEWIFIPYNDTTVTDFLYNSEFGLGYFLLSHNYVSLPHLQDLFAVYELRRRNLVNKGCVFVPGHSGDFVAGSHIPSITFTRNLKNKSLVDAIYDKHYSLYCNFSGKIKREVRKRIIGNSTTTLTSVEFADSYELQDWRNRQAKFIVNSVRVYDYCGFSWWLPFWDRRCFEFWRTVPLEYRYERNLYNEYVDLLSERYNINVCKKKNTKWFYFVRKISLLRNLKRIKQTFFAKFSFYNKKLLLKKASCSCMKAFYTEKMMKQYCKHTNELNGVSIGFFLDFLAEKLKIEKKN